MNTGTSFDYSKRPRLRRLSRVNPFGLSALFRFDFHANQSLIGGSFAVAFVDVNAGATIPFDKDGFARPGHNNFPTAF